MKNTLIRTTALQSRGKMVNGEANPIDVYVGKRARLRREMLQISQTQLADRLGITFQQVQKYEKGINRMGASRLWDMAVVLKVPVNYFYDGIGEELDQYSPRRLYGIKDKNILLEEKADPLLKTCNLELIHALEKIKNSQLRQTIYNLVFYLANANAEQNDTPADKEFEGHPL